MTSMNTDAPTGSNNDNYEKMRKENKDSFEKIKEVVYFDTIKQDDLENLFAQTWSKVEKDKRHMYNFIYTIAGCVSGLINNKSKGRFCIYTAEQYDRVLTAICKAVKDMRYDSDSNKIEMFYEREPRVALNMFTKRPQMGIQKGATKQQRRAHSAQIFWYNFYLAGASAGFNLQDVPIELGFYPTAEVPVSILESGVASHEMNIRLLRFGTVGIMKTFIKLALTEVNLDNIGTDKNYGQVSHERKVFNMIEMTMPHCLYNATRIVEAVYPQPIPMDEFKCPQFLKNQSVRGGHIPADIREKYPAKLPIVATFNKLTTLSKKVKINSAELNKDEGLERSYSYAIASAKSLVSSKYQKAMIDFAYPKDGFSRDTTPGLMAFLLNSFKLVKQRARTDYGGGLLPFMNCFETTGHPPEKTEDWLEFIFSQDIKTFYHPSRIVEAYLDAYATDDDKMMDFYPGYIGRNDDTPIKMGLNELFLKKETKFLLSGMPKIEELPLEMKGSPSLIKSDGDQVVNLNAFNIVGWKNDVIKSIFEVDEQVEDLATTKINLEKEMVTNYFCPIECQQWGGYKRGEDGSWKKDESLFSGSKSELLVKLSNYERMEEVGQWFYEEKREPDNAEEVLRQMVELDLLSEDLLKDLPDFATKKEEKTKKGKKRKRDDASSMDS